MYFIGQWKTTVELELWARCWRPGVGGRWSSWWKRLEAPVFSHTGFASSFGLTPWLWRLIAFELIDWFKFPSTSRVSSWKDLTDRKVTSGFFLMKVFAPRSLSGPADCEAPSSPIIFLPPVSRCMVGKCFTAPPSSCSLFEACSWLLHPAGENRLDRNKIKSYTRPRDSVPSLQQRTYLSFFLPTRPV